MRPITAQPGHSAAEVTALMGTGQFVYADCYTITPQQGIVIRLASAPDDVTVVALGDVSRYTYSCGPVIISGVRAKSSVGMAVAEQEMNLSYPDGLIYQGALTWPQALLQGRLDGATIRRDRFVRASWDDASPWLGGFPMFQGYTSGLDKVGRQSATVKVSSELVKLNRQMPPKLFTANCANVLYDAGCGADPNAFTAAGVVGAGSTRSIINWSGSSTDYALGYIHIENADSITRIRTVRKASSSQIFLTYPLDFDPVVGQAFAAYQGCDRTLARCPHFHPTDWQSKIKAFPFIPVAESAL